MVETVADFTESRITWPTITYPDKGDILIVSHIQEHHNKECRKKGIVLLHFEELPNTPGICDKTVFDEPNFIELLPPIEGDYSEANPSRAKSKKPEYQFI